ncbi:Y-family DNA polymerase [Gallionella capsiferriformans]|uniref:DNA-directed DNA polymerase n=1 Tax=Gallionella capsiferriformans (strain ES-2) TaxID=395494 RepID=D9SCY5_GALCS|nr:Y-family DNA polymerase [Gallionella capsiferriformans]ADL54674.1 DNA-directed DNA polymerase [Gallionella capsiferriformans ES-2]
MQRAIALVDCNNFYVSCERLFQPALEGKPVVILSNNDGCVVSRSQEVKNLGIAMAAPWFKLKELAKQHGIIALSSNYTLYADLSNRVMRVLAQFSPDQEVYSIDECFLDVTGIDELTRYAQSMRQRVKQHVGIPVCVGIAASKTLAKLANHVAKKRSSGICNFNALSDDELNRLLGRIEVGEVWGVGRRTHSRLQEMGITTVLALKCASGERIRAEFGITLARTVAELGGTACLSLDECARPRAQIICSRSFGIPVTQLADLEEAVIAYTSRAAEKLRRQQSMACCVQVAIRTNPNQLIAPQYQPSLTQALTEPSNDTRVLCHATLSGLRQIYRTGYAYQKAGIVLSGIIASDDKPRSLFDDSEAQQKSATLMATLDLINRRMGSGTLHLLGEGITKSWAMKRGNVSPRYTTELSDIALAHAAQN